MPHPSDARAEGAPNRGGVGLRRWAGPGHRDARGRAGGPPNPGAGSECVALPHPRHGRLHGIEGMAAAPPGSGLPVRLPDSERWGPRPGPGPPPAREWQSRHLESGRPSHPIGLALGLAAAHAARRRPRFLPAAAGRPASYRAGWRPRQLLAVLGRLLSIP